MTGIATLDVYNCSATATTVYGTSPASTYKTALPRVQACLTGSCCWGEPWFGRSACPWCQEFCLHRPTPPLTPTPHPACLPAGDNTIGQMGDNTLTPRPSPVSVGVAGLPFIQIVAGGQNIPSTIWSHTCGLLANNTAYCWYVLASSAGAISIGGAACPGRGESLLRLEWSPCICRGRNNNGQVPGTTMSTYTTAFAYKDYKVPTWVPGGHLFRQLATDGAHGKMRQLQAVCCMLSLPFNGLEVY